MISIKKNLINKKDKIFLAGHNGLVGSAVLKKLREHGYTRIILADRKKLDLLNQEKVFKFIKKNKPKAVIICAAKVGGVKANNNNKFDFLYENLQIQNNLIYSSHINNIKKLIFLGSSCIYPADSKQPIKENYILSGPLEKTNDAYAIAKIAGVKMCQALNEKYKRNYLCLMPPNIFGINDNFDLQNSHFIPALIRKICLAIKKKQKYIEVWGSGKPKRELMYDEDLAEAIIYFLNLKTEESLINVGSNFEKTINQFTKILIKISKSKLQIKNIIKEPDGVKRKIVDCTIAKKYGWKSKYNVPKYLRIVFDHYKKNYQALRN
jgi:GDP-L-fucose synthase